jgi:hypothetical protein
VQQYKQKPNYTAAYRFAARLFESAFAACEHLPDADRELLLKEIESQVAVVRHPNQSLKPIRVLGIEIK